MIYDLHNDFPTFFKETEYRRYVCSLPTGVTPIAAIWTSGMGDSAFEKVEHITEKLQTRRVPIAIEDVGFLSEINRYETFDYSRYSYCSLTWNFNNDFAGGALDDGGLTELGKRVISLMACGNCVLDVAHLNKKSFYAAIEHADRVLCSHTGFNGHLRSLDDRQIRALIEKCAIVGLCAVTAFTDAHTADGLESVIDGFVQKYGVDNLAIGSDFCGSSDFPPDVTDYVGLAKVADGLLRRGYDDVSVNKIFYGNAYRFFNTEK
ncbi:MAG: dipeptidase [Clostridiales bacterium]|nr:dipeptidase [Clostridiales bacterium]